MAEFGIQSILQAKRQGGEHARGALTWLVAEALQGAVTPPQLAAWLMAACIQGLSYRETLELTQAFAASGQRLDWAAVPGVTVDKHSTGGVGDKISLIIAPWLAALGLYVPKMSGRGLGHTGGTIDKLASIPGLSTRLTLPEIHAALHDAGWVIVEQMVELVPADKLIYALRNETATVESPGLIAASVVSKKLAAGASCAVIDIKCGAGAFFNDVAHARQFAELVLRLGRDCGLPLACVITQMDQPLGCAVGNAWEVDEAWRFITGAVELPDVMELCLAIGTAALSLTGVEREPQPAKERMLRTLASGAVADRFQRMVKAQGGDWDAFQAKQRAEQTQPWIDVRAEGTGYLSQLDARAIGELAHLLDEAPSGAQAAATGFMGVLCLAKCGARIGPGQVVASIRGDGSAEQAQRLRERYLAAMELQATPVDPVPVVLDCLM